MRNLKKLRESKGLSQQKLASYFNISQQSIYKYENNLAEPDLKTLMKFSDFFNTSVDYLIGYSNCPDIEISIRELPLNTTDTDMLKKYLQLPDNQKNIINEMINCLHGSGI